MKGSTLSSVLRCDNSSPPRASSSSSNIKTKGVKLVSATTEKELLPQELCYCLGFGHLKGVKELEDFAPRGEDCRDCRRRPA